MTRLEINRSRVARAAYWLAALLVLVPLIDYVANVWPPQLNDVQWRDAAEGLGGGFLLTPCLGVALASAVAIRRDNARLWRSLGVLMTLAAVGLLPVGADFVLNTLQLRHLVAPATRSHFEVGALKVVLEYGLVALGLLFSGLALARAGRPLSVSGPRSEAKPPVIIARPRVQKA